MVMSMSQDVNEAAEPLLAPSQSHSNTASPATAMLSASTTKNAQNSPAQLDNASAKNNLGASSLVQIWEARLNRSNSINSNHNRSQSTDSNTSRASSTVSSNENNAMEQPSTRGPFDEIIENQTNNVDSLIDSEPQLDRITAAEAASSCCRTLDAGETERVRIVDIIEKLKKGGEDADDHEHINNDHKHCSTSDQAEHKCFSLATNLTRLRWRQAINDLLIQRKQDKNRELDSLGKRHRVSKFPQRGRLQSMLRLRSLQRCQTIQDKCRPQLPEAHLNRLPQASTIMHFREKFSTGADHLTTPQNVSATSRCLQKDNKSIGKPQQREESHCQKGDQSSWQVNRSITNKNEDVHEQAKPISDAIQQKTSLEARCPESLKTANAMIPLEDQPHNEVTKKQGSNSQQHIFLASQETTEPEIVTRNEVAKVEQEKDQHHLSLESQQTMETSTSLNSSVEDEIGEEEGSGNRQHLRLHSRSEDIVEKSSLSYNNDSTENEVTEEEEDHYQQYFDENNDYDWFSNVSRPRSYWESLRKEWYQEVLSKASKNGEIRELVERGRVSTLLASDFRESMDRLLTSRIQMQSDGGEDIEDKEGTVCRGRVSTLHGSDFLQTMNRIMTCRAQIKADGTENQKEVEGKEETVESLSCLQRNLHTTNDQGEEEDDDEYEDEDVDEEERSLSSHQCHEANNYFNHSSSSLQLPSPYSLLMRSWSSQDDNETRNDYERGASVFSLPPQPSQVQCYQGAARQSSSSTNRPSLEIELICDLRGHMEQLHHEVSELRKSILMCTEMQMKLQHYMFNGEAHSGKSKDSAAGIPWKRSCCICYEMQVDSLLYRCGHMCTCLKCGKELQWRSGKCPICRAPILDVVPAK
ncbi:hypothetical protein V6N12_009994 [Hibiscus sabdariffa]|uniref:RING-type domain-containing protein n=1 Tax=Hibiscus sabdariffa TaxID=183260 RepID=A0ABR2EFZ0_9ROSI